MPSEPDWAPQRIICGSGFLGQAFDDSPLDLSRLAETIGFLEAAVDAGIRLVDTADIYAYGKDEQMLGRVLAGSPGLREHILIQTKCGLRLSSPFDDPPADRPHHFDFSAAHVLASVDGSLERLGIEYLDVLLLHRPDLLMEPDEIAQAFDTLHRAGKVRHFGVSNFSPADLRHLQRSLDQPILFNQVRFGLGHPDLVTATLDFNRSQGRLRDAETGAANALSDYTLAAVRVQAWSPLQGCLPEPGADRPLDRELAEVGARYGLTPMATAIAWILRHPAGILPVVGTSRIERLRDYLQAGAVELDRADWYRLLYAAVGAANSVKFL
jgi:predicted oxidoreductase